MQMSPGMRKLLVLTLVSSLLVRTFGDVCTPNSWQPGVSFERKIIVQEQQPYLKQGKPTSVERRFLVTQPRPNVAGSRLPVVVYIHGQGDSPEDHPTEMDSLAIQHDFIAVYPQGMDDGPNGSGWNVGAHGDNNTCSSATPANTKCYESCGWCGPCDAEFIRQMLKQLELEACSDPERLFVLGFSNGGMFVHHLLTALPGVFLGAVPTYGLPMLGYLAGSNYEAVSDPRVGRTSLFALHDRQDTVIPMKGGADEEGYWYYEPLYKVVGLYAKLHGCNLQARPLKAPVRDSKRNLACFEHPSCAHGKVAWCEYDGWHGEEFEPVYLAAWLFFESLMQNGTGQHSDDLNDGSFIQV